MFRQEVFDVLLLIVCVYALWHGGGPERIAATAFFLGDALSVIVVSDPERRFGHPEWGVLAVDCAMLAALTWLAVRSTRWWPLFVAGFQLDEVVVHAMRTMAPGVLPMAYLNGTALWSYPMVFVLIAGTWRHRQRLTCLGADPDWVAPETVPKKAS